MPSPQHRRVRCTAAAFALFCAATSTAQHGREMRRRVAQIEALIVDAGRDVDAGHREDAARTLRTADSIARGLLDEAERRRLAANVAEALRTIDTHADDRRDALAHAAATLRDVATAAAADAAMPTALVALAFARRLAPHDADAALDALLLEHADAARDGIAVSLDWPGGEVVLGPDTWSFADGEIATGELDGKLGDYLLLSGTRHGSRCVVRADLHFDRHSIRAGFVLGYRHSEDFVAVEVTLLPRGRAAWIAKRKIPGTWQTLGNGELDAVLGADGITLPLCVDTSRRGMSVQVGDDAPSVIVPPELGDVIEGGVFGVSASARVGIDRHVRWRGLQITTLSPRVERADAPNATNVIAAANALVPLAESYVAAGWLDTGRELLQHAADLGDDATRASIETLCRRHGIHSTDRTEALFGGAPGADSAAASGWVVTEGRLSFTPSPREEGASGRDAHLLLSPSQRLPFHASATIRTPGSQIAAGLHIGMPTPAPGSDAYRCTLTHLPGLTTLHLTHVAADRGAHVLAQPHYFTRRERDAGIRLELACNGPRMRCRVADADWAIADIPPLPTELPLGCVVTIDADAAPVWFSKLDVWDR